MSIGTYWYLRVPTGILGCVLVSVGMYWYLSVPIGVGG